MELALPLDIDGNTVADGKLLLRVESALRSKDLRAQYIGICTARKLFVHNRSTLLQKAPVWIPIVLPLLNVLEHEIIIKAAVRLFDTIFLSAKTTQEFQRQIVAPAVLKYTQALTSVCEGHHFVGSDVKAILLSSLCAVITNFPSALKSIHPSLSKLSLSLLSSKIEKTVIRDSAASLFACLPHTGGKVASATLWRKAVDDQLMDAFQALSQNTDILKLPSNESMRDHLAVLERLDQSLRLLRALMSASLLRPVQVPVGSLSRLAGELLGVSPNSDANMDNQYKTAYDKIVTPSLRLLGCNLISCLVNSVRNHLSPYSSQFLALAMDHLDGPLDGKSRALLLNTISVLLRNTLPPIHDLYLPSRILRAAVSVLIKLLPSSSEPPHIGGDAATAGQHKLQSRNSRKRARDFESDDFFRSNTDARLHVRCPDEATARAAFCALEILQAMLVFPQLPHDVRSVSVRTILALLLDLQSLSSANFAPHDSHLLSEFKAKLADVCITALEGSSGEMSKALPLLIRAVGNLSEGKLPKASMQRRLDVLLHPRVPPLLRALPATETLALFRAEESSAEQSIRGALRLTNPQHGALEVQIREPPDLELSREVHSSFEATDPVNDQPLHRRRLSPPENHLGTQTSFPPPPVDYTTALPKPTMSMIEETPTAPSNDKLLGDTVMADARGTPFTHDASRERKIPQTGVPVVQRPLPHTTSTPAALIPRHLSDLRDDDDDDEEEMPTINLESDTDEE